MEVSKEVNTNENESVYDTMAQVLEGVRMAPKYAVEGTAGTIGGIVGGVMFTGIGLMDAPNRSAVAAVMSAASNPSPDQSNLVTTARVLGLWIVGMPIVIANWTADGCKQGWDEGVRMGKTVTGDVQNDARIE